MVIGYFLLRCAWVMIFCMEFKRISILGVGLIGGSVGLSCRKLPGNYHIKGYSHRPYELRRAVERGAIDEATADPAEAVAAADLVILCTPVGSFGKIMSTIAPALRPGAIVTDVGSTKRSIVKLAAESLPSSVHFVGSHPMVGGEKHGIDHARADLLAGGLCIVTPTETTNAEALKAVEHFWLSLQMRTSRLSPEDHDRVTADISHLPHLIAAALVRMQKSESLPFAGRGFAEMTRIAAGDPVVWRDILLENRENLKSGVGRLQKELQVLVEHLDAGDAAAVQAWLECAASMKINSDSR